jgi:predicted ABC-type transport system involved in lysophospholipase L1 biosynthesis ATPase subunit
MWGLLGSSTADLDDPARFQRDAVGVVFQPHHLIADLTAEENVELPLIPGEGRRRDRLDRARAALAEAGLEQRRTHLPSQMSGGERQRVALALVARLLLADEPRGALDSDASCEVLALLTARLREHGTTVLPVSHEPAAAAYADRTERMVDGRSRARRIRIPQPRDPCAHSAGPQANTSRRWRSSAPPTASATPMSVRPPNASGSMPSWMAEP